MWAAYSTIFFCFMVSGPGLPNPTPFGVNIASIPGSDQPVTINNLNGQNFSQCYIDNAGGSTVQFDGFTIPLWAKVAVQPGETYQSKSAYPTSAMQFSTRACLSALKAWAAIRRSLLYPLLYRLSIRII